LEGVKLNLDFGRRKTRMADPTSGTTDGSSTDQLGRSHPRL
jgi:hypothetical protein